MTDSDEKAVEIMARAILAKVPHGYGMTAGEAKDYARAAYEAHQRYVKETMNEIVMGEGGDVEDVAKH